MKIAVFSTRPNDQASLVKANGARHSLAYFEAHLSRKSAAMAANAKAVCAFVNDQLDRSTLELLGQVGTRLVALRCTGFNNVDLDTAAEFDITIASVPAYYPHAVAERTAALILSFNRHIRRADARAREGYFSLDWLLGLDMQGRPVGIVGTGKIGLVLGRIMTGFGCRLLATDPFQNEGLKQLDGCYVTLPELLAASAIVSLHCPLMADTRHMVGASAITRMKPGLTSRGAVIDTRAVIAGLKSGRIGQLGLDVYEEEEVIFFDDRSEQLIRDDVFARQSTFPNVLVTGHQAFFTSEALMAIAETTIANFAAFAERGQPVHPVRRCQK